jgi:hypothetical protein
MNANQMTTDKVRLSFVHLDKPHSSNQDGSNPKYSVTILLPKSDVATKARLDAAYQAAVTAGVASKWNGAKPPVIACPIYDGDGVRANGEPFGAECKGHWVFTAGNRNQVPVIGLDMGPIINPSDIYSGMYARVCVSFYAYAQAGKRGIGCGLEAVQKVEDGEPLSGSVSVADAFGGTNAYTGASAAPQQPQAYSAISQQYQQPMGQQYAAIDPITGQVLPW